MPRARPSSVLAPTPNTNGMPRWPVWPQYSKGCALKIASPLISSIARQTTLTQCVSRTASEWRRMTSGCGTCSPSIGRIRSFWGSLAQTAAVEQAGTAPRAPVSKIQHRNFAHHRLWRVVTLRRLLLCCTRIGAPQIRAESAPARRDTAIGGNARALEGGKRHFDVAMLQKCLRESGGVLGCLGHAGRHMRAPQERGIPHERDAAARHALALDVENRLQERLRREPHHLLERRRDQSARCLAQGGRDLRADQPRRNAERM